MPEATKKIDVIAHIARALDDGWQLQTTVWRKTIKHGVLVPPERMEKDFPWKKVKYIGMTVSVPYSFYLWAIRSVIKREHIKQIPKALKHGWTFEKDLWGGPDHLVPPEDSPYYHKIDHWEYVEYCKVRILVPHYFVSWLSEF